MTTPRSCRFPPTPQMSSRKRELFPSPLSKLCPLGPILAEISNTPRRSNRIASNKLTPVCENVENITPSSRVTNNLNLSDDSSDLGHMSSLELSSSPVRYDSPFHRSPHLDSPAALLARPRFFNKQNSQLLNIQNELDQEMPMVDVDPETPRKSFAGIFVKKNHLQNIQDIQKLNTSNFTRENIEQILNSDSIIPETPEKHSPSINLRTPHEIFKENIDPPKLHHRKIITEISSSNVKENVSKLKRHLSKDCFDTIDNKIAKLDPAPRARTSLFSAKSFYSQTQPNKLETLKKNIFGNHFVKMDEQPKRHRHISSTHRRKRFKGEINMGVKHKIRKPKPKRDNLNSSHLLNAALKIIENSPLNSYLNSTIMNLNPGNSEENKNSLNILHSIANISNIVENTSDDMLTNNIPNIEKSKRKNEFSITLAITDNGNSNQQNVETQPSRKFFKSRRSLSNKVIKLQDNLIINIKSKNDIEKNRLNDNHSHTSFNISDQFKDLEGDLTKEQREVEKLLEEWDESDESSTENISKLVSENQISSSNNASESAHHNNNTFESTFTKENNKNEDVALLSPTSHLSSMTSSMVLESPVTSSGSSSVHNSISKEYYPLFYKGYVSDIAKYEETLPKKIRKRKMWYSQNNQYQIDAGQKNIGLTYCNECNLAYQQADPEEELFHYSYHNSLHILNFQGWKNECIISVLVNVGRIIHIKYNAPKAWHRKVQNVLTLVDSELGIPAKYEPEESTQVYLMANSKQIIGILLAKTLSKAHRMISSVDSVDLCTEESFDVKCGVLRIWVAPPYRENGYATAMLNAMRCNFMFGKVLDLDEIAFSSPTQPGISLAKKFSRREDFLVFQEF